jgi:lactoylglutathione lyase
MTVSTYLIVKDMTASLAFYKAYFQKDPLGGCTERFASFDVDNTNIALYNPQFDNELIESGIDLQKHFNSAYLAEFRRMRKTPILYGNNMVLNIVVNDLATEYERVAKLNIGTISDIMYVNIVMPYYYFNLYDPDENCLEITGAYSPV